MSNLFDTLDEATQWLLEKTSNSLPNQFGIHGTQEEYDKHHDALNYHSGAILHHRADPETQKALATIAAAVPHRNFIERKIDITNAKKVPTVDATHVNASALHEATGGQMGVDEYVKKANEDIAAAHKAYHGSKGVQALHQHGQRFVHHLALMKELHNLREGGRGTHFKFAAHVEIPELDKKSTESPYAAHSRPSKNNPDYLTTQYITKAGGAGWHPGLPEVTSLEEFGDEYGNHPHAGSMKQMYPFENIKVNGENLKPHKFDAPPDHIHDADFRTALPKSFVVRDAEGKKALAQGVYSGHKSHASNFAGQDSLKTFKKSEDSSLSTMFPDVDRKRLLLAKNLMGIVNPFSSLTDDEFADKLFAKSADELSLSEQAMFLIESESRLEKASKQWRSIDPSVKNTKATVAEPRAMGEFQNPNWREDVKSVLNGQATPIPRTEANHAVTAKENTKYSEIEDLGYKRERKKNPFAVPAHVFSDAEQTKIDPQKYLEWVHEPATDNDLHSELLTYGNLIKDHPSAREAHEAYKKQMKSIAGPGIKSSLSQEGAQKIDTPVKDHRATLDEAAKKHQAGEISADEYRKILMDSSKATTSKTKKQTGLSEMSPDEKSITEIDPSYKPTRAGPQEAAVDRTERALTTDKSIFSKPDGDTLDDAEQLDNLPGEQDNDESRKLAEENATSDATDADKVADEQEHGKFATSDDAESAKDYASSKKDTESGSDQTQTQIQKRHGSMEDFANDNPQYINYLKMRDEALSHVKTPEVRKYLHSLLAQHETGAPGSGAKLAAILHTLHAARDRATKTAHGQTKLLQDVMTAPESQDSSNDNEPAGKGSSLVPETMLSPEQRQRLGAGRVERTDRIASEKASAEKAAADKKAADEKAAEEKASAAKAPPKVIRRAKQN
jgi:hypothetical protein